MKNLVIEPYPNSGLVQITYEGGGETPDALKGAYTSPAAAKEAIKVWQANGGREEVGVVVANEEAERKAQERLSQKK